MARLSDDLDGHLTSLDNRAGMAALQPDCPPDHALRVKVSQSWDRMKRRYTIYDQLERGHHRTAALTIRLLLIDAMVIGGSNTPSSA